MSAAALAATVAVTGLNACDNPAPGVGVIRALRAAPGFRGRIIGLAYDALEPGLYAEDLLDAAYLIPYVSRGAEALAERLAAICEREAVDVIIPTLDAELPAFIACEGELRARGARCFLPSTRQLELRSKQHLIDFSRRSGIAAPASAVIAEPGDLLDLPAGLRYPVFVKGVFYGARLARSASEAIAAYHEVIARWGGPVIVQEMVAGTEYDVAAVGDGRGGLVGAVPMRKLALTAQGKGWAGVSVRDPELLAIAARFMEASGWRGPCEVELMRTAEGYRLMEINPRFPAWILLSAGAGVNLPLAAVALALGEEPALGELRAGAMFVRIALDQVGDMSAYEALTTRGELRREREAR